MKGKNVKVPTAQEREKEYVENMKKLRNQLDGAAEKIPPVLNQNPVIKDEQDLLLDSKREGESL